MPAQCNVVFEVSPRAMTGARFEREGDRVRCVSVSTRPLGGAGPAGWMSELTHAFFDLQQNMDARAPVRVALSGVLVLTRVLPAPPVRGRRARQRIVRFEAEQLLPYPSGDYVWTEGAVEGGLGEALWLASARREVVESVFSSADAAGIEVASIEAAPLLLARVLSAAPGPAGPRALVLVDDHDNLDIVILDGAKSVLRSVALGNLDSAPAPAGTDPCDRSMATIVGRVRQEVIRTVAHHRRNGGAPLARLQVAAPESQRDNIVRQFSAESAASEVGSLNISDGFGADPSEARASVVLRTLAGRSGRSRPVTLVPRKTMRQARLRRAQPWLQATALLLAVALVMPLIDSYRRLDAARAHRARLDQAASRLRDFERRRQDEQERLDALRSRVQHLERLSVARGAWVRLLAELQGISDVREGFWIESLTPLEPERRSARTESGSRLFGADSVMASELDVPNAEFEPMYLLVACLLDPSAEAGDDRVFRRARAWLERLESCPQVVALEHERFEPDPSGLLRVKVLVTLAGIHGGAST